MRTKHAHVDEAGVMAGFGCLDTPCLVDEMSAEADFVQQSLHHL